MEQLERARDALKQGARASSPEDMKKAQEQAAEQEEIRKQLLDLAKRNKERKGAKQTPHIDQAEQEAGKAKQSLEEGDLNEADQSEEAVQKQLEQAKQDLKQEEEEYQRLRQEELLFKIGEELEALVKSHREAAAYTREIDGKREAEDKPSRAQRLALKRIAKDEAAIAARADELAKALEAEGAVVFSTALQSLGQDLTRVAGDLDEGGDWQTGGRTQSLQDEIERGLGQLIDALKNERKRREDDAREKDGQPPGDGQNQPAKEPLVPDSAELKLLAAFEADTVRSLNNLIELYPELAVEGAQVDPRVLNDVQRLAERHERTTALFARFRERLGMPDPTEQ